MEQVIINNQPTNPSIYITRALVRIFIVSLGAVIFWLGQFYYQYYIYEPGIFQTAWVRSHALTGTTLLVISLGLSIIFKFNPSLARQWRWRRNLGVAGFVFIFFHVAGAMRFYFGMDYLNPLPAWRGVFINLNPFTNPILFGIPPYVILITMAITSSDWMVNKLKKWWKVIHRFVYLAEVGIVFHAVLTGGPVMKTIPGYLLYILAGLVLFGQIYWWWRISKLRAFKNTGFYTGLAVLILFLIIFLLK